MKPIVSIVYALMGQVVRTWDAMSMIATAQIHQIIKSNRTKNGRLILTEVMNLNTSTSCHSCINIAHSGPNDQSVRSSGALTWQTPHYSSHKAFLRRWLQKIERVWISASSFDTTLRLWGNLRNCKCCLVETHTSWWCHKGRPHTSHTPHTVFSWSFPFFSLKKLQNRGHRGHRGHTWVLFRIIPQGSFLSASFCIDCQDTQHRRSRQGSHARDLRTNINGFTMGYFGYCWVSFNFLTFYKQYVAIYANPFCFVNRFYLTARWIVII